MSNSAVARFRRRAPNLVDWIARGACRRKRSYPTLEAAEQAAMPHQVGYCCGFGSGHWHLTTRRGEP